MADNTQLNNGVGGDLIATKSSIDYSSGAPIETKTQLVMLATAKGIVGPTNPLPTEDARLWRLLEVIIDQQDTIIEQGETQISLNKKILAAITA